MKVSLHSITQPPRVGQSLQVYNLTLRVGVAQSLDLTSDAGCLSVLEGVKGRHDRFREQYPDTPPVLVHKKIHYKLSPADFFKTHVQMEMESELIN